MFSKKYLAYFILVAAALLLFAIKQLQTGHKSHLNNVEIAVPIIEPIADQPDIDRNPANIIYSKHAQCRMECRHIDTSEVMEILANGIINVKKIQTNQRGTTYPLEGVTHDQQHVRIVFATKSSSVLEVVTCIDLDTEWPCNCR